MNSKLFAILALVVCVVSGYIEEGTVDLTTFGTAGATSGWDLPADYAGTITIFVKSDVGNFLFGVFDDVNYQKLTDYRTGDPIPQTEGYCVHKDVKEIPEETCDIGTGSWHILIMSSNSFVDQSVEYKFDVSEGSIVGVIIFLIVVIGLICCCVYCCRQRNAKRRQNMIMPAAAPVQQQPYPMQQYPPAAYPPQGQYAPQQGYPPGYPPAPQAAGYPPQQAYAPAPAPAYGEAPVQYAPAPAAYPAPGYDQQQPAYAPQPAYGQAPPPQGQPVNAYAP